MDDSWQRSVMEALEGERFFFFQEREVTEKNPILQKTWRAFKKIGSGGFEGSESMNSGEVGPRLFFLRKSE